MHKIDNIISEAYKSIYAKRATDVTESTETANENIVGTIGSIAGNIGGALAANALCPGAGAVGHIVANMAGGMAGGALGGMAGNAIGKAAGLEDESVNEDEGGGADAEIDAEKIDAPEPDAREELASFIKDTNTNISIRDLGEDYPTHWGEEYGKYPHNKYRVTITTPNGRATYVWWDSTKATQTGEKPDEYDVLSGFVCDAMAFDQSSGLEDFLANFGYGEDDYKRGKAAYNACGKMSEKASALYSDEDKQRLFEIQF